jgi:hypothetical protein
MHLSTVAGVLVILLLALDVFLTILHAVGHGGPVTRFTTLWGWRIMRWIGIHSGNRRRSVLALAGPLLLLSTLVIWVVMLVGGYALIFRSHLDSFTVQTGTIRSAWIGSLYYSMYTATTMGTGGLVANRELDRIVSGLEGISGFALFTAAITYLLSVYTQLMSMNALAAGIAFEFRDGCNAILENAEQYGCEPFARWAEGTAETMLLVLQAHFQYPVLHYFRPHDDHRFLTLQLHHVFEMREALAARPDGSVAVRMRDHPSWKLLNTAVDHYLQVVDRYFVPHHFTEPVPRSGDAFTSLRRLLCYMGERSTPAPTPAPTAPTS